MLRFLLPLLVLSFGSAAHAQDAVLRGYGLKGGYTTAHLDTDPPFTVDPYALRSRSGFHAAAFAEWQTVGPLSVVTQVGYTQRGYGEVVRDGTPTNPNVWVRSASRVGYVSMPLLLKLRHVSEKATGYALAGPALDLVLHRDVGVLGYASGDEESLFVREVKPWALGGALGVGMEVSTLLPWVVFVEARYYWEVTDALSNSDVQAYSPWTGSTTGEVEARGRALEFSFGFMF